MASSTDSAAAGTLQDDDCTVNEIAKVEHFSSCPNNTMEAHPTPNLELTTHNAAATSTPTAAKVIPNENNDLNVTMKKKQKTQHPQTKKKQTPQVLFIRRTLQQCCRTNDLATAMQVYHQAIHDGVLVEAQSLYNLLNLCDGLGDRPLHIGTPIMTHNNRRTLMQPMGRKLGQDQDNQDQPTSTLTTTISNSIQSSLIMDTIDWETRKSFAFAIKKDMDNRNLPLTETAYTALIRMLARAQQWEEADRLLRQAEETPQCKRKLRLYSSLLSSYCDQVNPCLDKIMDLWVRICNSKLFLTEREYTTMMQCATRIGHAPWLQRCLDELAQDVWIPSKETIQILLNWFQSPHATSKLTASTINQDGNDDDNDNDFKNIVTYQPIHPPPCLVPSMGPVVTHSSWIVDYGCTIHDGILQSGCFKGYSLQPVPLSEQARQEMIEYNQNIVLQGMVDGHDSSFQGGGKGPKRKVDRAARAHHWKCFKEFLISKYEEGGIDVVIDGANVGYYKQNFSNAPKHVNYRQIDVVIQYFAKLKMKILLILHARHFSHNLMPAWAKPIVQSWYPILYRANHGMNDDWFWLHAALWGNANMLTNDEMRDHHFQMLAPRSFLRWKERHQIHFSFERIDANTSLELHYPNKYSRRIQRVAIPSTSAEFSTSCTSLSGFVIPLAKRGDENRFLDGVFVANEEEPQVETYLCIGERDG